jgi:hypothetical protein
MYTNGKIRHVGNYFRNRGKGVIKENNGVGEFNYDILI